jgi:hypothetical protein
VSLNVEGGLTRIVHALRVMGKVWFWGVLVCSALWIGLAGAEIQRGDGVLLIAFMAFVVAAVPAGAALGAAWLLAGFLEPKR